MPTMGMMVGAVFLLANSQHSADPADNATCHPADNAAHEAADRPKHLISGAGTSVGTMPGAWSDTLSASGGCYRSERDHPDNKFQVRLHVLSPPTSHKNAHRHTCQPIGLNFGHNWPRRRLLLVERDRNLGDFRTRGQNQN
jgi:hypothetical protein